MLLGLTQSAKQPKALPLSYHQVDSLHRHISLAVIGLTFLHAIALLWDHMGDTVITTFIPFTGSSQGAGSPAEGLGILAFWLAMLLGPTYYLRRRLGPRAWRVAHRFTLVVYILGVWHTFAWGSDLHGAGALRGLLWPSQVPVAAALLWRLLDPARRRERMPLIGAQLKESASTSLVLRLAGRAVVLAVLVGVIVLVVTGRTGGSQHHPPPPAANHHQVAESPG